MLIDEMGINFLKMSYENAYNISLRKKVFKRDYAYIYTTCTLIFNTYNNSNGNEILDNLYHKAIILFSRTLGKTNN